jgi:hypothetical protein
VPQSRSASEQECQLSASGVPQSTPAQLRAGVPAGVPQSRSASEQECLKVRCDSRHTLKSRRALRHALSIEGSVERKRPSCSKRASRAGEPLLLEASTRRR